MAKKPTQNTYRNAAEILLRASEAVAGPRNSTYGDKVNSFQVIADFWNCYLESRDVEPGTPITSVNVAQMMELLKIARSLQSAPVEEHFMDAAGYAAIAGEIAGVRHG